MTEEEKNMVFLSGKMVQDILKEKLPEWFRETLKSDYSNPLKDAVEEAIKEKDGVIKNLVKEMLAEVIDDDNFKIELKQEIVMAVIQRGLQR